MDLSELKLKCQKNVQEQNAFTKESIRAEAEYYRKHGVPQALHLYGESQGIDWRHSIIIDLEIDYPGLPSLFGLLLTQRHRFIDFEIDTGEQHSEIITIEKWEDVTAGQNFSEHNPGAGVGFGALALDVLKELEPDE